MLNIIDYLRGAAIEAPVVVDKGIDFGLDMEREVFTFPTSPGTPMTPNLAVGTRTTGVDEEDEDLVFVMVEMRRTTSTCGGKCRRSTAANVDDKRPNETQKKETQTKRK